MSKIDNFISEKNKNGIKNHFTEVVNSCWSDIWQSSEVDEDVITGGFFSRLGKDQIYDDENNMRWKIEWRKFGNSGENAEKKIGADGIIQIRIVDKNNKDLFKKGLLFQAKKGNNKQGIKDQMEKMRGFGEKYSSIVHYSEDGVYAYENKNELKTDNLRFANNQNRKKQLAFFNTFSYCFDKFNFPLNYLFCKK